MTLTELLVVIMILVILLGVSLPMMRTGLEGRATGEAARQLSTAVVLSKALAAETGRPAGLIIETKSVPEAPGRLFAQQLFLAETPPYYQGDSFGARAWVRTQPSDDPERFFADFDISSAMLRQNVRLGDLIRFDSRDPAYEIVSIRDADSSAYPFAIYTLELALTSPLHKPPSILESYAHFWEPENDYWLAPSIPYYVRPTADNANGYWYVRVPGEEPRNPGKSDENEPIWPTPVREQVRDNDLRWQCVYPFSARSYQVIRSPQRSSVMPVELPNRTLIDLQYSGFGQDGLLVPSWGPENVYRPGYYSQPTQPNGFWYFVVEGGTSGPDEPSWPETPEGEVRDNQVLWQCVKPFPITIVFSPSGRLLAPSTNQYGMNISINSRPFESLNLLVGTLENFLDDPEGDNLRVISNRWVTIGHRSGRVTTAENAWDWDEWDEDLADPLTPALAAAREFAQLRQGTGGR